MEVDPNILFKLMFSDTFNFTVQYGRGHTKETGNRNFREFLSASVEHMLLNGAVQIEETALPFPHFAMLHSVTRVQLRPKVLGNCGCVAVASFLGVPSPKDDKFHIHTNNR
jgi:hypothetical protein